MPLICVWKMLIRQWGAGQSRDELEKLRGLVAGMQPPGLEELCRQVQGWPVLPTGLRKKWTLLRSTTKAENC